MMLYPADGDDFNKEIVTIYGYKNTYAHEYATTYGFNFVALDPEEPSNMCGDNLTWTLHEDGTLEISGTGAMWDWNAAEELPWYEDISVIKSIVINNGVTDIGTNAFIGCVNLNSVSLPYTLNDIGNILQLKAPYTCSECF